VEYRLTMSLLREIYQPLLTPWQADVVSLYYDHDLSLGEIAEMRGVTRNAVHSALRRATAVLEAYEARLGLLRAYQERKEAADQLEALLEAGDSDMKSRVMALVRRVCS